MKYEELTKEEAKKIYDEVVIHINNNDYMKTYFDNLDEDYKRIRNDILEFLETSPIMLNYDFDLRFALEIYEYFNKKIFVENKEILASNYAFWRYICLKVFPDVVYKRHGLQVEYYYEKNVRLYFSTLWWYIEMAYQGNREKTYLALKNFTTDYILQLVERPGREGMYLEVSRGITKYLATLPSKVINEKYEDKNLIRRLLIQKTASEQNFNLIIEGKSDEYVKLLFKNCGVEV